MRLKSLTKMRLAAPTGLCLLAFVSLVGCQGTTRSLKEIFIGRCHEFYRVKFPDLPLKNCSMLWDKFHKAFSNRSACDVKPEDYKDYLEYADDGRLLSKTLFWEATKDTVEVFTRLYPDFIALGNTVQGYIPNDLTWCGGSSKDGINYTRCPDKRECGFEVYYPYWAFASKQFAQKVKNVVYVLLNGSRQDGVPTYSRNSYFSTLELPYMNNKTVTELRVWVIYDLEKSPKEKCGEKSLVHLAEDTKKFGIKYTCTDNPEFLRPLMCAKYPNGGLCEGYRQIESIANSPHDSKLFALLCLSLLMYCLMSST